MTNPNIYNDFPKAGVNFVDISPVLADNFSFNYNIDNMAKFIPEDVDYIVSPESRGFIFGAALAYKLNKGLLIARKKNKLPKDVTLEVQYKTEYSYDSLYIPNNIDIKDSKCIIVDDILATGGTAKALLEGIKELGATCTDGVFYGIISGIPAEIVKDITTKLNINYIEVF